MSRKISMQEAIEDYGITPDVKDWEKADRRHGGPWDRGSADSYYHRGVKPHYFKGATYQSEEITRKDMTEAEIDAYLRGYFWNEIWGDKKEW